MEGEQSRKIVFLNERMNGKKKKTKEKKIMNEWQSEFIAHGQSQNEIHF